MMIDGQKEYRFTVPVARISVDNVVTRAGLIVTLQSDDTSTWRILRQVEVGEEIRQAVEWGIWQSDPRDIGIDILAYALAKGWAETVPLSTEPLCERVDNG